MRSCWALKVQWAQNKHTSKPYVEADTGNYEMFTKALHFS